MGARTGSEKWKDAIKEHKEVTVECGSFTQEPFLLSSVTSDSRFSPLFRHMGQLCKSFNLSVCLYCIHLTAHRNTHSQKELWEHLRTNFQSFLCLGWPAGQYFLTFSFCLFLHISLWYPISSAFFPYLLFSVCLADIPSLVTVRAPSWVLKLLSFSLALSVSLFLLSFLAENNWSPLFLSAWGSFVKEGR